jgi:hypothetical protein
MKLTLFALTLALVPAMASAAQLAYKIDLDRSKMDSITAFDICGLPQEIKLDAREDLATVVINKTQSTNPKQIKIEFIQASDGGIIGGDLREPYMGDYRDRVAIVRSTEFSEAYKGGVFNRVEVITYGSPSAPKAFTVDVELLNYRESAELAEGSVCTGYAYRLR